MVIFDVDMFTRLPIAGSERSDSMVYIGTRWLETSIEWEHGRPLAYDWRIDRRPGELHLYAGPLAIKLCRPAHKVRRKAS